jgi:hypothetical protein
MLAMRKRFFAPLVKTAAMWAGAGGTAANRLMKSRELERPAQNQSEARIP